MGEIVSWVVFVIFLVDGGRFEHEFKALSDISIYDNWLGVGDRTASSTVPSYGQEVERRERSPAIQESSNIEKKTIMKNSFYPLNHSHSCNDFNAVNPS